jgi:TolB-like protein/class 3 adenylate cyclase/Flp pilus assembly protein TadD
MADEVPKQRRLAAIMFTDMVGYSALSQRDEALALELLDEHRGLLRKAFARHGGREIEAVGDGFFIEFPSALAATHCAADIQGLLHQRNAAHPPERSILVRIGLHLGDVVVQGDRVHGDGVNIASRIEKLAQPGGVCLSEDVARQIQNKIELQLRKLGRPELKNIDLPVQIYQLVMPWESARSSAMARLVLKPRRQHNRRAFLALGGLLAIGAGLGVYDWKRSQPVGAARNRLAVLPFVSLSPNAADEYFADGITEELISRLSRLAGLEVIARTSVMSYKGTSKTIAQIGRELRVGTVLEGSVRKEGDKLRITAQLVGADNEAHLWADSYDQDTRDAFAIQKSIADRVAAALSVRLGTASAVSSEPRGTQSTEAYNEYLKGRFHISKSTLEGVKEGIRYFSKAISLDPAFALAYVGLAEAYEQLPIHVEWDPKSYDAEARAAYPNARRAALKAIDLDPFLAEAYTALGVVKTFYDYDWAGAESTLERALELSSNSSSTYWWYAWHQMFLRRSDEGMTLMRRAVELDPVSIAKNMDLGNVYQYSGRWDLAVDQLERTLEMDRSNVAVLAALGWAYLGKGKHKEAEAVFMKEAELTGHEPLGVIDLVSLYGYTGQTARALAMLNNLKRTADTKPLSGYAWVLCYFGLAVRDERYRPEMYKWLEQALEERSFYLASTSNPWWTPFHADFRWAAFRSRMRLPP